MRERKRESETDRSDRQTDCIIVINSTMRERHVKELGVKLSM